jgi:hypothetical protein
MEIGGFDISIICRPSPHSSPSIPPSSHSPSLSPSSPSLPLDQCRLSIKHNQQILLPRNENLFFLPSLTNKFSQETLELCLTYSSLDKSPPIELKQLLTLQKPTNSAPMVQNFQLKKKDLAFNVEVQSSWIPLEFCDLNQFLKSSSEVCSSFISVSVPLSLSLHLA